MDWTVFFLNIFWLSYLIRGALIAADEYQVAKATARASDRPYSVRFYLVLFAVAIFLGPTIIACGAISERSALREKQPFLITGWHVVFTALLAYVLCLAAGILFKGEASQQVHAASGVLASVVLIFSATIATDTHTQQSTEPHTL